MSAKLFKGRKKVKWNGLSGKQEQKLIDLIHSNPGSSADDATLTASTARLQPCPSASSSSSSLDASSAESSMLRGDTSRLETSTEDMSDMILTPELPRCLFMLHSLFFVAKLSGSYQAILCKAESRLLWHFVLCQ
jgi:hypothetical protein